MQEIGAEKAWVLGQPGLHSEIFASNNKTKQKLMYSYRQDQKLEALKCTFCTQWEDDFLQKVISSIFTKVCENKYS